METAMLEVRSVTKAYAGTVALSDASFSVPAGSVLAVVGENGAGKSTLLNVISGIVEPDSGQIRINGRPVRAGRPSAALRQGIATVHQELTLFPDLAVWENVWSGHEKRTPWGTVARRELTDRTRQLLGRIKADIDPTAAVGSLSLAQQTQVEIAKALAWDPHLLILDEASSALGSREVEALFHLIADLKASGVSVIYVSHRLGEVLTISDSVLALRDGRQVGYFESASELDEASLITTMIGRSLEAIFPPRSTRIGDEAALDIRDAYGVRVAGVNLRARPGEIVGLGGLQGHGQQELLQIAFGARPHRSGSVHVNGSEATRITPRRMKRAGVAYIPADRKNEGLLLPHSVEMNSTLAILDRLKRTFGLFSSRDEKRVVEDVRRRMRVVQRTWRQPVGSLSGGNQQKVLIGRWVERNPDVLLLDEPTRGVDIGTKAEIYHTLRSLADAGKAIVIASTENAELLGLCDRIVVMYDGRIAAELNGETISEYELTSATMGVAKATADAEASRGGAL